MDADSRKPAEQSIPQQIPSDETYFSPQRFREWAIEEFGVAFTLAEIARRCESTYPTIGAYLNGTRSPTFENLYRMAAAARVPVTRWLGRAVYKTFVESGE